MKEQKFFFYLIIFVSYLLFLSGFIFKENITSGAIDWPHVKRMINGFTYDFTNYFREWDVRHSPILYIFLSFLKKLNFDFDTIRLFYLHINLLTLIFIYKCFQIKFQNSLDKIYILILSITIVLLSPNLRTAGYWPLPYPLGLFFLSISFYSCLKYLNQADKKKNSIFIILNILFVAFASYISPNFSLFSLFFAYIFLKKEFNKKTILIVLLSNLILSLPALYYFFIYNPFFIFSNSVHPEAANIRFNFINKIVIIFTIIFFHLLPFLVKIDSNQVLITLKRNLFLLVATIIFFILSIVYFNFKPEYGGGGIFLKLSYVLTNHNYLFLMIYSFSIMFIYLISANNIGNIILIVIFILMNPQLSIYHRYYDPLVLIVFLLFFNHNIYIKNFLDKKMILFLLLFVISFNLLYIVKNYI